MMFSLSLRRKLLLRQSSISYLSSSKKSTLLTSLRFPSSVAFSSNSSSFVSSLPSFFPLRKFSSASPTPKIDWQKELYTIPNLLTFLRLGLTPGLCYLILESKYPEALVGLFCLGALDWLDGFIARRFNQTSVLGSYMDPLADKALLGGVALSLAYMGTLPAHVLIAVVGRDLMLVAGGFAYRAYTKPKEVGFFDTTHKGAFVMHPTELSKANTFLQGALFLSCLASHGDVLPYALTPSQDIIEYFSYLVTTTTVVTGLQYLKMFLSGSTQLLSDTATTEGISSRQNNEADANKPL